MIYYKTGLEKIPENCVECRFEMCTLPMKANGIDIKKSCVNKRHKDCPLVMGVELVPMPGTTTPDWGEKHWGKED